MKDKEDQTVDCEQTEAESTVIEIETNQEQTGTIWKKWKKEQEFEGSNTVSYTLDQQKDPVNINWWGKNQKQTTLSQLHQEGNVVMQQK
jgi:hypothetical protein